MPTIFAGFVSIAIILAGVLCWYEYTLYTADEKARAPGLLSVYLGITALMFVAGIGGLALTIMTTGWEWLLLGVIGILAAASSVIQSRLHDRMGLDQSPFLERVLK
ncbi:sodium:proton antiporter [Natronolimnobius baerhuensis]|uniref:Uncharacterized protein n=1 Tax=Natronolimnobius baerhuensis TaxID=253108 RepID=A0A202E7D2_9EURY|nr:sodium:proton antiporter [Natronolimnobius baerhuensis]OVE84173.1 hypothetical protein B2G88_07055 [Natronolimnobius baerhuensis]